MALFDPATGSPFAVGTNPVSNATADLDGDGDLDLVTANYISDNVSVLLNNGNGTFVAGTPVAAGNGPREIEVGDLDGDGDIDVLLTNYSGNSVSVLLNNGNATFTTSSVAVGTRPRGLAVGDLDGDGDLDFVSANYLVNTVSVMLNNGSGSFSNATGSPITVGTRPVAIALGNFDGNPGLDIAVTSNTTNTVSLLFNNGSGTFTAAAPAATGTGPRGISAGDFDGDGDTDLVVANFGANTLSILQNDGSGVFSALPATLPTNNNPYAVTVGDLDGDGDLDIATTNSGNSSVSVFLNGGAGAFTPVTGSPFAVGVSPGGVVMGDFDGDFDLDLSTANFGSNTASVLLSSILQTPVYSVTSGSATEGTPPGAGGDLVFTVTRTSASQAENVTYTLGGTATTGGDYAAPSGTASFAIGQLTAQVHIAVTPDSAVEANETVILTLTGASGSGSISPTAGSATGTIVNDDANTPPTAVNFSNVHGPIAENASTASATKIADISVTDDGRGTNVLSLAGADAALFQIIGGDLWLKAGARLDFETNPRLDVTVRVNDPAVGGPIDASNSLSIAIINGPEVINGTSGNDTLIGTGVGETINGFAGNDRILGNSGNDRIVGGIGRDIVTGGPGNDVFVFTSIRDSAPGQSGLINSNTFGAAAGQGLRDIITDFTHGQDRIDLSAIDANIRVAGNQAFSWHGGGDFAFGSPGWLIERIYNPAGTANDKTVVYGDINGDARADFQIELTGLKHLVAGDFVL